MRMMRTLLGALALALIPLGAVSAMDINLSANTMSVGGVEVWRGDSSGNVMIGTTATSDDLHVQEDTAGEAASIQIRHSDNTNSGSRATLNLVTVDGTSGDQSIIFSIANVGDWGVGVDNSDGDKFKFSTTGALEGGTRVTIDRTGKGGIGTITPVRILETQGTSTNTARVRITAISVVPMLELSAANGTEATPTAILNTGGVGSIMFRGHDGVALAKTGAIIKATATENWSSTARGTKLEFNTVDAGGTANSTKMTIDHDGMIDIGTEGGGQAQLRVKGSDATGTAEGGELQLFVADDFDTTINAWRIDAFQDDLRFGNAGGNPLMIIDSGVIRIADLSGGDGSSHVCVDASGNLFNQEAAC